MEEAFTIESGLLTANGKLKRDVIAERFQKEIEAMYAGLEEQCRRTRLRRMRQRRYERLQRADAFVADREGRD